MKNIRQNDLFFILTYKISHPHHQDSPPPCVLCVCQTGRWRRATTCGYYRRGAATRWSSPASAPTRRASTPPWPPTTAAPRRPPQSYTSRSRVRLPPRTCEWGSTHYHTSLLHYYCWITSSWIH